MEVRAAHLLLFGLASLPAALGQSTGAALQQVSINQVVAKLPSVRIFVDVRGNNDEAFAKLAPTSITAEVGGSPIPLISLTPFSQSNEGVGYVFLVDVSKSVSPALFVAVKSAILSFTDSLKPADKATIITFGDHVDVVQQFTGDKNALKATVNGLKVMAPKTQLNLALLEGLRAARRLDANLPERRAIIVLSDGKDEGSGLTAEDILHENEINRIPIYSLGVSSLASSERSRYLEVLQRYSVLSGGRYKESRPGSVGEAYRTIHDGINRVWTGNFDCSDCPTDGRPYPLEVHVTVGQQALADRATVSLGSRPVEHPQPRVVPWWQTTRARVYAASGGAVVVIVVIGLLIFARKKGSVEPQSPQTIDGNAVSPPPLVSQDLKAAPLRQGCQVELIPRDDSGGQARLAVNVVDHVVLGRSADAGLRIPAPEISGQHCALDLVNGRLLVTDLGSKHGTAVNGIPIKGRQNLESGDLLALGRVEFRIRFDIDANVRSR